MSKSANYGIAFDVLGDGTKSLRGYLVLEDLGPHDSYQTITNAAEQTVTEVYPLLLQGPYVRRLFYIDSVGELAELVVQNGQFFRFRPAPAKDLETMRTAWRHGLPAFTVPT